MSDAPKGFDEFVAEATEIVEGLSSDLLKLDEGRGGEPDPDLLNQIFRAAHSLKGLSGLFAQERMAHLAHRAEDLLDQLRLGKTSPSDVVVDALVETLDVFQALLAEASRGTSSLGLTERARRMADRLTGLSMGPLDQGADPLDQLALPPEVRQVLTEYEESRLRHTVKKGLKLWKVRARFDLADFDVGLQRLSQRLKPVGELISTLPSSDPEAGSGIAFDLLVGSKNAEPALQAALAEAGATLAEIPRRADAQPLTAPARVAPPPPPAPALTDAPEREASLRSLTQTVRVDIHRLDALMNVVGELLLVKANVQRLAEAARSADALTLPKAWGQELSRESRLLERRLDELQKGILDARMVPLGQVFDKLARLVRRIAREAGREIDFAVSGGEVELDKLIVEELSDPLMHIIRNAIDHGIEPPPQRAEAGKPRRGRITLRARQQGNHVIIEVADDGAGIDLGRVRDVAQRRVLITQDQDLGSRELLNLLFMPGFSTASTVSEISGRGVGLDVVKTNIANLSGIIDLETRAGRGTAMTLTLPLTLAIVRALVVSVSERSYAVPLNSVLETLSVQESEVGTVERREVVSLRGQTVPLVRLARLFGLPERVTPRKFVVVVGLAQQRLGIAVDELLGQHDIVTKPLGGRMRQVRGISGATDLGNRRVVLVLDVGALVEEVLAPEPGAGAGLAAVR